MGGVAAQWAFAQGLREGVPITGAVMNGDVLVLVAALGVGALALQIVRYLEDRTASHVLLLAAPLAITLYRTSLWPEGAPRARANALAPIGTHLACALCAAAALHPSMVDAARFTAPVRCRPPRSARWRGCWPPTAWCLRGARRRSDPLAGACLLRRRGGGAGLYAVTRPLPGCAGFKACSPSPPWPRWRSNCRPLRPRQRRGRAVPSPSRTPSRSVASTNDLASCLPDAIAEDQLTLHYQPIVRLGDGAVVGAEALLRWTHPSFGPVPPATFIPLAERIGLLDEVGDWVIGRAFSEGDQLLERLCVDEPYISINVAPSQIERPGFVASVRTHLDRLGVAPDGYVFELTEQGMVADRERAVAAITDLQELGVLVAMDDFGAGNASLISLSNLDLDIVKLDRALVAGLDTSRGYRILRTAVDLLRDLGVVVIAEGIEQPAVAGMLTRLGVHYGQGFGLGRPEPLAQLVARIGVSPVIDLRDSVVKPLFGAGR